MAGIYIHIPFCRQKCHYCNFFSLASSKQKTAFLQALKNEIHLQKNYLGHAEVETVYFGGGTPSLLSEPELNALFEVLHNNFSISPLAEISLEANPDDLDLIYLNQLLRTPVNRLSIGVQSFRKADLVYLNRVHSEEQALKAVQQSLDAGFENLSIDLIYGIPTLEDEHWCENLEMVASLNVAHLSAYALTVEPKTPLERFIRNKKVTAPDEDRMVHQFRMLLGFARKNDYDHYEISNLCREPYYSKHNTSYWNGDHYLGLGPSAHSFNGHSRQWNEASLSGYIAGIGMQKIPYEMEVLTEDQKFNEYLLTSLRTKWGAEKEKTERMLGESRFDTFQKKIEIFIQSGKVALEGPVYVLTDEGKLFADRLTSELFV